MTQPLSPFAADLIPIEVMETLRARRHLASLSPERRAQLQREWFADQLENKGGRNG